MHVAVYLSRGSCGHRLGQIIGRLDPASTRGAPRTHGLPEITTHTRETVQDDPRIPAQQREHEYRYRFDGHQYAEVAHTQHDAVCHHCPLETCSTERAP